MCKFESSQQEETRAQSTDGAKACSKARAFNCYSPAVTVCRSTCNKRANIVFFTPFHAILAANALVLPRDYFICANHPCQLLCHSKKRKCLQSADCPARDFLGITWTASCNSCRVATHCLFGALQVKCVHGMGMYHSLLSTGPIVDPLILCFCPKSPNNNASQDRTRSGTRGQGIVLWRWPGGPQIGLSWSVTFAETFGFSFYRKPFSDRVFRNVLCFAKRFKLA